MGDNRVEQQAIKDWGTANPYAFSLINAEAFKQAATGPTDAATNLKNQEEGYSIETANEMGDLGLKYLTNKFTKVIELDKDLIEILRDTDLDTFEYEPLPYPVIFINNDFNNEQTLHKGVMIIDTNQVNIKQQEGKQVLNQIMVLSFNIYDDRQMSYTYIGDLSDFSPKKELSAHESAVYRNRKERDGYMKGLINFIKNTIDILKSTHEDIEYIDYNNKERNIKRVKRGKPIFAEEIQYIRLGGTFKQYATAYTKAKNSLIYKTLVRGHFRHYRSERYVNKQGDIDFMLPYIKGAHLPDRPDIRLIKVTATEEYKEKLKERLKA